MFATVITNASNFFHFAAVFAFNHAIPAAIIVIALVVLNAVRKHAVATRKRRQAKRIAVIKSTQTAETKRSFDPFAPIKF